MQPTIRTKVVFLRFAPASAIATLWHNHCNTWVAQFIKAMTTWPHPYFLFRCFLNKYISKNLKIYFLFKLYPKTSCKVLLNKNFYKIIYDIVITSKGYARYALSRHISRHGLTTAMQHLVETGKVFRGSSN